MRKVASLFFVGLISPEAISSCVNSKDNVFIPDYGSYVAYQKQDGHSIFEGDIIVDDYCEKKKLGVSVSGRNEMAPKSVIIGATNKRWPNNKVFYKFSSDYSDPRTEPELKHQFMMAIEYLHAKTPIRFIERTTQSDYINIRNNFSGQCSSSIGRVGGVQSLYFSNGCGGTATAIHEIFHALGYWHEQSHPQRDAYVEVLWDNIIPSLVSNFNKRLASEVVDPFGFYDYKSIMHYEERQMSVNGLPTLASLTSETIAPSARPTAHDLESLHNIYPPATVVAQLTPVSPVVFLGTTVEFSALDSYDASVSPETLAYNWTIADGTSVVTSTQMETSKSFSNIGKHQVTLNVSKGSISDTISTTVNVWGSEIISLNALVSLL